MTLTWPWKIKYFKISSNYFNTISVVINYENMQTSLDRKQFVRTLGPQNKIKCGIGVSKKKNHNFVSVLKW